MGGWSGVVVVAGGYMGVAHGGWGLIGASRVYADMCKEEVRSYLVGGNFLINTCF